MTPYRLPILTYHSLDSSGSVISTTPSIFRRQMEWLHQQGFQTLSLAEAARLVRDGQPFRERTCVVTFDDGYETVYREAFPVLEELGFTATVFLITGYCGKQNSWPGHVSPVGEQLLLSWTQIEEMARHHIEFGSHTVTHPDLACVTRHEAAREMRESKQTIQERLGGDVEVFAYPYGKYASWVVDLAKEHFTGACSTILGKVTSEADSALLPRVDMYYLSSQWLMESLDTRGMDLYLGVRRAMRATKAWFA
ncbi:MAG TPA: polysaccharide deacetylase family protein [Nitrospira sp.]|jgi:peptidoglycan/xylan/chitin deacetylase (PgdA/CDA1 family)|uniref:polysaccharide deacetylase family protein n=1 Tax=Nitrospira sp. ND1 TaxID=1658518 RepID=UPI0009BC253A|nr:polysaccharide deacetylase family protein [Nitrospira sp. ND1]MBA5872551.1 polysaccharide deacetylase family protein [Nitrospira sp. CR2.1]MBA5874911.1 polysaccharide deacetylase family protein [Nitrospira sp. CR1.2]MBK7418943.1 polysaccharide deacetylase family protein [Nitrospira sp.]MBP6264099.1 polysaccharide deacetylase family protein [Nitrospira sp.]SLM43850.1 putative Polysaccharide deacetylase [Nitrospira sp. ND1]